MTVDNVEYSQSGAMLRFVARLKSTTLYPTDPLEQFKVEELLGIIGDFRRSYLPALYFNMKPQSYGHPEGFNKTEEGQAILKQLRGNVKIYIFLLFFYLFFFLLTSLFRVIIFKIMNISSFFPLPVCNDL